jgi:hypothetical protein
MSSAEFLWVYEDRQRGLALIRGHGVQRVLELAGVANARFSVTGKGWVVPGVDVPDVVAMAQYDGVVVRFKEVAADD